MSEIMAWITGIGTIVAVFAAAEDLKAPTVRKWVGGLFLADRKAGHQVRGGEWASTFGGLFDRLFGEKHLSLRCYWRSLVATLLAVAAASIYVLLQNEGGRTGFTNQFSPFTTLEFWVFTIVVTGSIDYLSLLESRYFVRRIAQSPSAGVLKQVSWLAADIVVNPIVFLAGLHFFRWILTPLYRDFFVYVESLKQGGVQSASRYILDLHAFSLVNNIGSVLANARVVASRWTGLDESSGLLMFLFPGTGFETSVHSELFFATTYITSIFLWVFGLTVLFLRVMAASDPVMDTLRNILPWQEKPITSFGWVAAFLYAIGFWIVKLV